jgi:hypothetical protein
MNIDSFLAHYDLNENPFGAEEARLDPVFPRLAEQDLHHPDFDKIIGQVDQPSTAVVFGEKGSGKTAIRLTLANKIAKHNQAHPDERVLVVAYDDFNPTLDRLMRTRKQDASTVLSNLRLADHQDAILSEAVTPLVSALIGDKAPGGEAEVVRLPDEKTKYLRKRLNNQQKIDLAILAGLYDQPPAGMDIARWRKLCKTLKLGFRLPLAFWRNAAILITLVALGFGGVFYFMEDQPWWVLPVLGLSAAAAIVLWVFWLIQLTRVYSAARKTAREMPAIGRQPAQLRSVFGELGISRLAGQPLPQRGRAEQDLSDSRYQLTRRLISILKSFGYAGLVVLIDRVDEPSAIAGDAGRMRSLIWPMFDNKFLKQDSIGIKLLLPIELSYLLQKEGPAFFQEARLDKQNMIEKLTWSGAMLYDLMTSRLRACRDAGAEGTISLTDLFKDDVSRDQLVDALDQMHQPRDAFKFIYAMIQDHCRLMPDDAADYKIARLTLEAVRRTQSQRVQELYRGLTPA